MLTDPPQLHANDFYSARQTAWAIRQIAKDLKSPEADRLFLSGNDDPLCLELPSGPEAQRNGESEALAAGGVQI